MNTVKLEKEKVQVQKDGETKNYTNFYLLLQNGYRVQVRPSFSKDYKSLVVIAVETQKGDK